MDRSEAIRRLSELTDLQRPLREIWEHCKAHDLMDYWSEIDTVQRIEERTGEKLTF